VLNLIEMTTIQSLTTAIGRRLKPLDARTDPLEADRVVKKNKITRHGK
jgi:hypothetical protein